MIRKEYIVILRLENILLTGFFLCFAKRYQWLCCNDLSTDFDRSKDIIILASVLTLDKMSSLDTKQFAKLLANVILMHQVTSKDTLRISTFHRTKMFFQNRKGNLFFLLQNFHKIISLSENN